MNRYLCWMLLLLVCGTMQGQIPLSPNTVDSRGLRQGQWTILFDGLGQPTNDTSQTVSYRSISYRDGRPDGRVVDYSRSGVKQWEGELISENPDVWNGHIISYYPSGQKKAESEFSKGKAIGHYIEFYENGTKKLEGEFRNNEYEGLWDLWTEDGAHLSRDANMIKPGMKEWERLRQQTTELLDRRSYVNALPIAERALRVAEEVTGTNSEQAAISLMNLALVYGGTARYADAETLYVRSFSIVKRASNAEPLVLATWLDNLAGLHGSQGNFAQAESLHKEALRIYERDSGPDHREVATCLNNLAKLYYDQGRYGEAEPLCRRAVAVAHKALGPDNASTAVYMNTLALVCLARGRSDEAELLVKQAITINEQRYGENSPLAATCLHNLALVHEAQGRYAEAEILFKRAITVNEKWNGIQNIDVLKSLAGLSGLYKDQGRYSEAEPMVRQAIVIGEGALGTRHPDVAQWRNNLAVLCRVQGRYAEAESLFSQALIAQKEVLGLEHPSVLNSLANVAELYTAQRRFSEAESVFNVVTRLSERIYGSEHRAVARCLNNLAMLYLSQGRHGEAELLTRRSLAISEKALDPGHPDIVVALSNLGLLCEYQRRYDEAKSLYMKSNEIIKRNIAANFPSLSEREKSDFYTTVQFNFEAFNSFVLHRMPLDSSIIAEALNNQLATKALLFDATRKVNILIRSSGDSELKEQFELWRTTKEMLAKAYTLTRTEQRNAGISVDSIEGVANEIEKELGRRSEAFKKEYQKRIVTWGEVLSSLQANEAGIEIVRFRNPGIDSVCYGAMIVTPIMKDHPDIVVLENGIQLEDRYRRMYESAMLISRTIELRTSIPEEVEKQPFNERELYSAYWQQIQKRLSGIKTVYLSVDGVYNSINVGTLKMPDGRYVGELLEIRPVTSLRDLVEKPTNQKNENVAQLFGYPKYDLGEEEQLQLVANLKGEQPPRVLAYVDRGAVRGEGVNPLPGTAREITQIEGLLKSNGWRTALHMQEGALEEAVKRVENPRVLHIATHGFFQPDVVRDKNLMMGMNNNRPVQNPLLRTGVLLAGAEQTLNRKEGEEVNWNVDDGILTAYEAMNMNLDQTELVVLSACETGLGEVKNGEGVYGLQRAFQVAGARYVLMSLWKVDDQATQELMILFYREWLRTGDVRRGFREAQRQIRDKYHAPFYWGAFVLVGV
jgi:CHAT domain-containing protein/Flp pilus assembly protein TadD